MILHVNNSHTVNSSDNILTNAAFLRKYDLQERNIFTWDHDYSDAPNFATLTDYKAAAISYIASYVAKMTSKQLLCIQCCMALGSQNHPSNSKFVEFKDRGGLFTPTLSVIKICEETEQCFNRMLVTTGGSLPHSPGKYGLNFFSFMQCTVCALRAIREMLLFTNILFEGLKLSPNSSSASY